MHLKIVYFPEFILSEVSDAINGVLVIARECFRPVKFTVVIPNTLFNLSAGTFIGPGDGAAPGAGCGNAVDMAV